MLPKATADAKSSFREEVFANPISLNLEFFFLISVLKKKAQETQSKINFKFSGIFSDHLSKLV